MSLRERWDATVERIFWVLVSIKWHGLSGNFPLDNMIYMVNLARNLLVGGLEHFLFSHILGISSSQLTFIFFRGVKKTPTRFNFWIFHFWMVKSRGFFFLDCLEAVQKRWAELSPNILKRRWIFDGFHPGDDLAMICFCCCNPVYGKKGIGW